MKYLYVPPSLQSEENNGSVPEGDHDDKAMTNLALALEGGTLQEDPFLKDYRAKRLEEMKMEAQKGRKRLVIKHC